MHAHLRPDHVSSLMSDAHFNQVSPCCGFLRQQFLLSHLDVPRIFDTALTCALCSYCMPSFVDKTKGMRLSNYQGNKVLFIN